MVISNELDPDFLWKRQDVFELAVELKQKLGIRTRNRHLGGGIGIPYRPEQQTVDLEYVGEKIKEVYEQIMFCRA
jgi:diaminopimelate decarboxylase